MKAVKKKKIYLLYKLIIALLNISDFSLSAFSQPIFKTLTLLKHLCF